MRTEEEIREQLEATKSGLVKRRGRDLDYSLGWRNAFQWVLSGEGDDDR